MTRLPSDSVLAIPDRLAPKPEPQHRIWQGRSVQSSCHSTAYPAHQPLQCQDRLACAVRVCRPFGSSVASLAHQCMRQTGRTRLVHSSSELALTAATIGPEVDSTAVRLRAGDTRSACTKTRATTSHLAGPFGPEQLPQHRIPGTSASSVPGPTGVCCARVSAIRQLSRVTSSPMHAADGPHSIGAQQQRAGAHSGDDRA